ncbi:MAG: ATP-binding cassette domain-containing protein, partial [Bacteroidales bacterium]|nr:ATP-binding cassette domain-containing protein [Bacteroidales bacterium]
INDFSYKFARGERVAIVGPNGSGKSTMLNMLTGCLGPDSGRIETGDTVVTGYYRQGGISVAPHKTVLEVIEDIADQIEKEGGHTVPAAQFLRQFLFPNEMHHVRVESLSGGERKRLYLVTVLMRQPNFLLLDEPTNDLDILSLNVLEDYLTSFGGTVIIVSHDRFFVDKVADHLFVLDGAGGVKDFPGNYSEYLMWRKEEERQQREAAQAKAAAQAPAAETAQAKNVRAARPAKLSYAQKKELEKIDAELPRLNARKAEIEALLAGGESDPQKIMELSDEYGKVKDSIDEMEMRWLELQEIIGA